VRLWSAKSLLDDLRTELDSSSGVESSVYEYFYLVSSEFYKASVLSSEFYRSCLLYLAYVPYESLSDAEKASIAFDLGLAALVGDNIYNFGEMLSHQILASLNGTPNQWMTSLLQAFNTGNIEEYQRLTVEHSQQLNAQSILVNNQDFLRKKIAVMALMELVFNKPSETRIITFQEIATSTKLNLQDVEPLVMKALSLHVLKGIIDQVDQVVSFSWVQPRVLNLNQVSLMRDRLGTWAKNVHDMRNSMEDQTAELFS